MPDAPPPAGIEVGACLPGDLDEVFRIEDLSFAAPWNLRAFHGELARDERFRILVAREGPAGGTPPDGYAAYFDLGEEYHLIALAVRPDRRRRGIGSELLRCLCREAASRGIARVTLEVRISQAGAAAFYEKLGFIPVALRKAYYEDTGEDGLVMWRTFGGDARRGMPDTG